MIADNIYDRYFTRIRNRMIRQNKNWLCVICGSPGSGKSYSALTMAKELCDRFDENYLVLTPEKFIEKINDRDNLQKGDIIIFDEAGVGLSSRNWQSLQNKLMGLIFQTFRHLNLGVIFTVPNLSFIDVQARKLFHTYLQTNYIDEKKKLCYIKTYDIQHNSMLDKTYYKRPTFIVNGKRFKMRLLGVGMPPKSILQPYEKMKSEFTRKLNEEALQTIMDKTKKKEKAKCPECNMSHGYWTKNGWKCRNCNKII